MTESAEMAVGSTAEAARRDVVSPDPAVTGSGEPAAPVAEAAAAVAEVRRCRWCRRTLPERSGRGRPREFCSQRCRQWDWVARQRARELELSDGELVIAKATLDELHDDLYVLACAVDDVERDLAEAGESGAAPSPADLRHALDWLLDAARPLRDRELAPPA